MSRLAGGLYTSVRRLTETLIDENCVNIEVIGHSDAFTKEDIKVWKHAPKLLTRGTTIGRAAELTQLLAADPFGLLHTHFLWSYPSIVLSRHSSYKYVISPRGMLDTWAVKHSRIKKIIAKALYEKRFLSRAACIHALNKNEAKSIRDAGYRNPICIIPNGVDFVGFSKPMARSVVQQPWKKLLFLSRIHEKKGLLELIHAWKMATPNIIGWKLVVAGWGDERYLSKIKSLSKQLGLSETIEFVGPVVGVAKEELLTSANALVLPSYSEGLPMSVLEGWASGLPVIMTKECNFEYEDYKNCALITPPEPKALASAIQQIASFTGQQLHDMGVEGQRVIERKYTWSNVAEKMHSVYTWILESHSDAPECIEFCNP